MKKALTIYVDDYADLRVVCGAFFCFKENTEINSATCLNEQIPEGVTGLYLPWQGIGATQWIKEEQE